MIYNSKIANLSYFWAVVFIRYEILFLYWMHKMVTGNDNGKLQWLAHSILLSIGTKLHNHWDISNTENK